MADGPGRKPTISDEEILELFRQSSDPILSTSEVSGRLSLSRRQMLDRLKSLEDDGVIQSKSVGSRGKVWWLPGATSTTQDE